MLAFGHDTLSALDISLLISCFIPLLLVLFFIKSWGTPDLDLSDLCLSESGRAELSDLDIIDFDICEVDLREIGALAEAGLSCAVCATDVVVDDRRCCWCRGSIGCVVADS